MIIEHNGKQPKIDPSAYIAPNAVISGDVTIGPDTRILYGAVITSEGAPVTIGRGVVVMENAVVRGAGGRTRNFPCVLGDYTLIGAGAYVSGATLHQRAFVAAGAIVFNGAVIGHNAAVSLGAIVHIQTYLPPETLVPIQHVVIGNPCKLFAPNQAHEIIDELMRRNFREYVFDLKDNEILAQRYARNLGSHLNDKELPLSEVLAPFETMPEAEPIPDKNLVKPIAKRVAKSPRTTAKRKPSN